MPPKKDKKGAKKDAKKDDAKEEGKIPGGMGLTVRTRERSKKIWRYKIFSWCVVSELFFIRFRIFHFSSSM